MRAQVSRVIMNLLGAAPGPIDDMFLVKTVCCWDPDGLFKGLHVIHKLIGNNFDFVVNHNIECQLLVRPTNPYATKKLEEALQYTFKFDEKRVKIYKLVGLDLLPLIEDIFQTYHSAVTSLPLPEFFIEDLFIDLETTQNPIMSETTMSILGVVEGQHNQGLLAVKVQFVHSPHHITHAYHVVHVWPEKYKFAVDQNRRVYMKFDDPDDCNYLANNQFISGEFVIKFFVVQSVTKASETSDIGKTCPIYSADDDVHYSEHQFQ